MCRPSWVFPPLFPCRQAGWAPLSPLAQCLRVVLAFALQLTGRLPFPSVWALEDSSWDCLGLSHLYPLLSHWGQGGAHQELRQELLVATESRQLWCLQSGWHTFIFPPSLNNCVVPQGTAAPCCSNAGVDGGQHSWPVWPSPLWFRLAWVGHQIALLSPHIVLIPFLGPGTISGTLQYSWYTCLENGRCDR